MKDFINQISQVLGFSSKTIWIAIASAIGLWIASLFTFTVREGEQAIVLQFGEYLHSETTPGISFKWPWRNTRTISGPERVLTLRTESYKDMNNSDDEVLRLSAFIRWRIDDPEQFIKVLGTEYAAKERIKVIIREEFRKAVNERLTLEIIRDDNSMIQRLQEHHLQNVANNAGIDKKNNDSPLREEISTQSLEKLYINPNRGRKSVEQGVLKAVTSRTNTALKGAIQVMDFLILNIGFDPTVERSVFTNLAQGQLTIAADRIAEGYAKRNELLGEAARIYASIIGPGEREAAEIRGKTDAQILSLYQDEYQKDAGFVQFAEMVSGLENLKKVFADRSITLSPGDDPLQLLKR